MDGSNTGKIAFCSALFAGFAYFSLSILRDSFRKKPKKDNQINLQTIIDDFKGESKSCQTELTLPVGRREKQSALHNIPPELWSPFAKSIQDRIRDLNLRFVNQGIAWSRGFKQNPLHPSLSLQNTPKHTPMIRSPDLSSSRIKKMSCSAESLSEITFDVPLNKSLSSSRSNIGSNRVLNIPTETEFSMYKRTLDKLWGKQNPNISQQEASVLTMLLLSPEEDVLVKTLSLIANCVAFSINVDPICDAGCTLILPTMLEHHSEAVQCAATQLIGNLGNSERGQELIKSCIGILVKKLGSNMSEHQLNWNLIAIANLALIDSNHYEIILGIHKIMPLVSSNNPQIKLQSLKLLVNLSSNHEMVPYLLATKTPSNLFQLMDLTTDGDVQLRLYSFLANVVETACNRNIKAQDLPIQNKAASPETLYSTIFGFETSEYFIKKLHLLSNSPHEDVVKNIDRILNKLI